MKNKVHSSSKPVVISNRLSMSIRRSLALLVDLTIASLFCLTPTICQIFSGGILILNGDFLSLAQKNAAASILFALMLTPLPLLYLRFVFKMWLHSNTPGERITGIINNGSGQSMWSREQSCGLWQYVLVFFAALFSVLMTVLLASITMNISPGLKSLDTTGGLLCLIYAPLVFFVTLVAAYYPHAKSGYESTLDWCFGGTVIDATKPAKAIEES